MVYDAKTLQIYTSISKLLHRSIQSGIFSYGIFSLGPACLAILPLFRIYICNDLDKVMYTNDWATTLIIKPDRVSGQNLELKPRHVIHLESIYCILL